MDKDDDDDDDDEDDDDDDADDDKVRPQRHLSYVHVPNLLLIIFSLCRSQQVSKAGAANPCDLFFCSLA